MPQTIHTLAYDLDPEAAPLRNVYHLARAALAAYGDDAYSASRGVHECFSEHYPIVTRDLRGYVAANARDVVVVFRGSSQEREWVRGRHFDLVPVAGGRAHEGFVRLLEAVWKPLLATLFDARAADRNLWLAGHSVGGALALIAALRLEHLGFEPAMTATFGSPRVLDAYAAGSVRSPVYRVENADDPVPRVPWPSMGGYAHAGAAIRLMPTGAIAEGRHSDHIARRLDRVNELFEGRAASGMRLDHQMIEYVRKLAQHA